MNDKIERSTEPEEVNVDFERQVIPCCALCKHIQTRGEYDKLFGEYKVNTCLKFAEMARTFPTFEAMWHGDLIVMPKQINNCKHFEEKPKSEIPLFGTTSV